jgi:hypothetical protein
MFRITNAVLAPVNARGIFFKVITGTVIESENAFHLG